jgi:hypothetical protein
MTGWIGARCPLVHEESWSVAGVHFSRRGKRLQEIPKWSQLIASVVVIDSYTQQTRTSELHRAATRIIWTSVTFHRQRLSLAAIMIRALVILATLAVALALRGEIISCQGIKIHRTYVVLHTSLSNELMLSLRQSLCKHTNLYCSVYAPLCLPHAYMHTG